MPMVSGTLILLEMTDQCSYNMNYPLLYSTDSGKIEKKIRLKRWEMLMAWAFGLRKVAPNRVGWIVSIK